MCSIYIKTGEGVQNMQLAKQNEQPDDLTVRRVVSKFPEERSMINAALTNSGGNARTLSQFSDYHRKRTYHSDAANN